MEILKIRLKALRIGVHIDFIDLLLGYLENLGLDA